MINRRGLKNLAENSTVRSKVLGAGLGAFREWSLNQGAQRSLSGVHISSQTQCVVGSLSLDKV